MMPMRLIPPVVPAGRMAGREQPVIPHHGGPLLRPWRADDADVVLQAFADPDIQRWHFRRLDDLDAADAWIAATNEGWRTERSAAWAVVDPATDRPVGRVSLTTVDLARGRGEVSYWVLPSHRRRGVASRGVEALAGWSINDLGLHRLELTHSVANEGSCAVAARTGFEVEGTLRRALLHDDGWHDLHLHARLSTEPG